MGWTMWVVVCQANTWTRKSLAWYERFCDGDEVVRGDELRVALVPIELEDREPVGVRQPWFVLHGVRDGRIDRERQELVDRTSVFT